MPIPELEGMQTQDWLDAGDRLDSGLRRNDEKGRGAPLCCGNATLHRTRLGMMRAVIASKAKQSSTAVESVHICFVAMLLAMTISSHVRIQGIV